MTSRTVRAVVETQDVDEGVAAVRQAYPGSEWRAPKDRPFSSRLRFVGDDRLMLFGMDQRATVDATFPKQESYIIGAPTGSALRLADGRDRIDVTRAFLYPLRELTATWEEELHLRVTQLDERTVREVAAARYGAEPEMLQMLGTAPATPQLERYWSRVVAFSRRIAEDEDLFEVDLIRHDLFHTLVGALLTVFPHNLSDRTDPHDAAAGATASVRRAIAYMEEHAGGPITTAQLAAAARLSARGLQNAFQRQLGTSPLAYLRRIRLDGARRDLLEADPTQGATVAGIARSRGFTHLGRFAASYKDAYGEQPVDTLNR